MINRTSSNLQKAGQHTTIYGLTSQTPAETRTVETFARKANLKIRTIDDFRERKVDDAWIKPFEEFTGKQWADFSYKLPAGESLSEVQNRNIAALQRVL